MRFFNHLSPFCPMQILPPVLCKTVETHSFYHPHPPDTHTHTRAHTHTHTHTHTRAHTHTHTHTAPAHSSQAAQTLRYYTHTAPAHSSQAAAQTQALWYYTHTHSASSPFTLTDTPTLKKRGKYGLSNLLNHISQVSIVSL